MSYRVHSFRVGDYQCLAIDDGEHTYAPPTFPPPAVFLFADAPKDELGPALSAHGLSVETWKEWTTPYTCLLVDTGEERVLVDTGTGGLVPGTGQLLGALASEGVSAADIGHVVVTHAHPDHVGGCVDDDGKPVFENARYVVSKREHEFWSSEEAERVIDEHVREVLVGTARRKLGPIGQQLELVTGETTIVPGVRVLPAFGHTPGHLVVEVESAGEELLFLSDTVLHPVHLRCPHFCGIVDVLPDEVAVTRRSLLERAARNECLVLAFHFPFPGLGRVGRVGQRWTWSPERAPN